MTILRVGTNQKYAEGWDRAFGKKTKGAAKPKKSTPVASTAPAATQKKKPKK